MWQYTAVLKVALFMSQEAELFLVKAVIPNTGTEIGGNTERLGVVLDFLLLLEPGQLEYRNATILELQSPTLSYTSVLRTAAHQRTRLHARRSSIRASEYIQPPKIPLILRLLG